MRRKLVGGLLTAFVVLPVLLGEAAAEQQAPGETRPNIVIVMTDDMRLDDLAHMPKTQRLVGELRLSRYLSNHPMCCPARAQLLTGQNAERSGVFHNSGPFGAYHALREPDLTLATWFHDAGYNTGFAGKFLNGWWADKSRRPDGWTDFNVWQGDIYSPHDWVDWNSGHPRPARGVYTNDGVTRIVREQIGEYAGDVPFLVWASYVAPHGMIDPKTDKYFPTGPRPAPRHRDARVGVPLYQAKPSYTHTGAERRRDTSTWRNRIRSLLSVDDGVQRIVRNLRDLGEWSDTVMIFVSDNGMLLGEHDLHGKNLPYEEAVRVPFLATGPGIPEGTSAKTAMTIDIAPSLAALAGIEPDRGSTGTVEGRSDLFSLDGGWADGALIQGGSDDHAKHFWWRGQRTSRWTYVEWIGGRRELYDRSTDPYEMRNLHGKRAKVEAELAAATPNPY